MQFFASEINCTFPCKQFSINKNGGSYTEKCVFLEIYILFMYAGKYRIVNWELKSVHAVKKSSFLKGF